MNQLNLIKNESKNYSIIKRLMEIFYILSFYVPIDINTLLSFKILII